MIVEQIHSIEHKVKQLIVKVTQLQLENAGLSETNRKLRAENKAVLEMVSEPEQKQRMAEATKSKEALEQASKKGLSELDTLSGGGSLKWRKEIEQYVKEIDKCIERLQNY